MALETIAPESNIIGGSWARGAEEDTSKKNKFPEIKMKKNIIFLLPASFSFHGGCGCVLLFDMFLVSSTAAELHLRAGGCEW